MHRIRSSRGLTLLETIIVLALTGLVVGLVWIVVADAMLHYQVNQTARAITTTATRIRDFYRDRPVNSAANPLTTAYALDTDLVSPDLVYNGALVHYLGVSGSGPVGIVNTADCIGNFTSPIYGFAGYGFEIELDQLTANACNQLAAVLAGTSSKIQSNGLAALFVAGHNMFTAGPPPGFNQALVQNQCVNSVTMELCFIQTH